MKTLAKRLFLTFVVSALTFVQSANAAPLWIERQFIPASELIDPIFEQHDAASQKIVDHTPLGDLLTVHLVVGEDGVNRFNYGGVTPAQRASLGAYIKNLETTDTTTLQRREQLALWINLYNAVTLAMIVDHYPTDSIRDIDNPWNKKRTEANGVALTLNDIESRIIRPVFNEPLIHYGVNCAAIGCPNLAATPYTGAALEEMLTEAAHAYINHQRGVRVDPDGDVTASKIYGWYREDFGETRADLLDHIRRYATPALRDQLAGARKINDYEYDWSLNDASKDLARN